MLRFIVSNVQIELGKKVLNFLHLLQTDLKLQVAYMKTNVLSILMSLKCICFSFTLLL